MSRAGDFLAGNGQRHGVDHGQVRDAPGPRGGVDQPHRRTHGVPDDARRRRGRERFQHRVQVRHVLDEMIEAPRAHPLRVAVPAEVERHRAAREQRSKRVEGAGVVEPAVQEQGGLSVSALQRMEREPAHVEQAVVHGRQRNILTARSPFVTRAQWQIRSSAS